MGTFALEAVKDEDYIAFPDANVYEVVTLTPNQRAASVVLKFGPKAGRLLPSVTDKVTGKPIVDCELDWRIFDPENPGSIMRGDQLIRQGERVALVPPRKYLIVTISAPGYKTWHYQDSSDPSRPAFIRLQGGEEKELVLELEPQAGPTDR
jgi:hypothetical protein